VALQGCAGADDQSDIHQGTRVRLLDDRGRVIARTRLGPGRADGDRVDRCRFRFTMREVGAHPSYTFRVAERDAARTVTRTRLARDDWRVTLTPS
jgi:hypothetical protein